jgi:hypothetical protein
MAQGGSGTMLDVRPLTAAERPELKRMRRQDVGRVSRRGQSLWLAEKPWTGPPIAPLLERHRVTVRSWLERCARWGPEGLDAEERSGRPRKMTRTVARGRARGGWLPLLRVGLRACWPPAGPSRCSCGLSSSAAPLGEVPIRGAMACAGCACGGAGPGWRCPGKPLPRNASRSGRS